MIGRPGSPLPRGHPLAGLSFQQYWEKKTFEAAGADYCAPAQRVVDYLKAATGSSAVGQSSIQSDVDSDVLPDHLFMGKLKLANLHR